MPALHRSMPRPGRPGLAPPRGTSWTDRAACSRDGDPDAWHADADEKARVKHAKAVCAGCPVAAQCLEYAMDRGEQHGIWGGMTSQERVLLRDSAQLPAAPAAAVAVVSPVAAPAPVPVAAPAPAVAAPGPRAVSPMDLAAELGALRARHSSITATARAAGMSRAKTVFYLDLLDLDQESQARVHTGKLQPEVAVAAVRSQLRARAS